MEQEKKKGGAGRVVLIILGVLAALGFAGYLGLRALVKDQMSKVNDINLSVSKGQEAPDFVLPLTDGSEAKLSELLKDKEVVVLNIFASWCGPCEKEFPDMEKTYQKYKDKMEIVAVSGDLVLDEMEDMVKYKEEHNLSFLIGMKNESIDSLKVGGFPTTEGDFEKVVTSLMGDDYEGKQVALYNFYVTKNDKDRVSGIEIRLYNDTVDETITTGEDGIASYFTQDAQDLKIEILNLPDGYTSNADSITLGIESGTKMITIEKK